MISEVKANQSQSTSRTSDLKQQSKPDKAAQVKETKRAKVDTVKIGTNPTSPVVYTKSDCKKLNTSDIEAIKQQVDMATQSLRTLVEKLILKQKNSSFSVTAFKLDADTVEQAKQSISEDGEFGVKAVSDRIVNFAIAISGNDKSKLSELKTAIEKGFAEAEKAFGGKLPAICGETHDEIMRKLDQWNQEE